MSFLLVVILMNVLHYVFYHGLFWDFRRRYSGQTILSVRQTTHFNEYTSRLASGQMISGENFNNLIENLDFYEHFD